MRTENLGGTLADRLRSGPLARAELEQLAADLLEMLASLHGAGKLHTDLNPETVRLDRAGRLHSSKVGAQRGSERTPAAPSGSPDYLAPELRVGKPADVGADLFACGVLLQECAGPDASAPVLVLIGMLTSAEPDLRPASADEALALLRAQAPLPPAPVPIPPMQSLPIPVGKDQPAPQVPPARPAPGYRQSFEKPKADPVVAPVDAVTGPVPPPPAPPPAPWVPPPSPPAVAPAEVPTEAIAFPPVVDFPPVESPAVVVDSAAPVDYPAYPAAPNAYAGDASRRRPSRRIVLGVAAVAGAIAAGVGIGLAVAGGDSGADVPAPASDAQLGQQLDGLDQAIDGITAQ
jgi:serine/threonine protein kinase